MNRIVLLILLLAVLLVTAPGGSSSVGAPDEPPSYVLRCRGTSDFKATAYVTGASYKFKKGTRPADAGLGPGECSWLDRGMREGEPDTLSQGIPIITTAFSRRPLDFSWTKVLKSPENYWTFYVYTADSELVVTDSKPYTKMTVSPSAPTFEAVIPRAGADTAAPSRAEAVRLPMLEPDTNRPGQDYKSLELTDPHPEVCQQACADDPKCKAFTYVKPGGQGPRAVCWLKSGVPAASKSDCCVSGVKPATTSGMVRPGAAAAIGLAAEVAPAADFPMFVAANSGKIVFLADMNGSAWNDYVRERASALTVDDSGILYYLSPGSQLLTRENKLGGPPQNLDMQVPVVDFKADSENRIFAVSTSQHCVVRMNDFGGGGFVRFGTKGSDASQFNFPQGVAIDSRNRIYIADTGNQRIVRMDDLNGSGWITLGVHGSGVGQFNAPWQIWVDKRDRIYVVDMYNARIVRIDEMDGSGWTTYGGFVSPRFVTTDKFNRVYIADAEADQVIRIDDMTGKGKKVLQFKRDTSSLEALNKPGSLAGPAAIFVLRPAQAAGRIR